MWNAVLVRTSQRVGPLQACGQETSRISVPVPVFRHTQVYITRARVHQW